MRITLFGATGRPGSHILTQALEAGHEMTVLVRTPAKLGDAAGKVDVVAGDLMDGAAVEQAVAGAEAVIMAAGPVKSSPPGFLETVATHVVSGMRQHGSSRLVWLTGAGVLDERDEPSVSRGLIRGLMKLVAGKVLAGSERAYEVVKSSGLDYTIVRPPMLADEPGGRELEAGYAPPRPIPVGRADLAGFLLRAAAEDTYAGESPLIGYRERG